MQELDKQLNPRELIEQKRKAFEEKYGDKLKRKAQRYADMYQTPSTGQLSHSGRA